MNDCAQLPEVDIFWFPEVKVVEADQQQSRKDWCNATGS